MPRPQLFLSWHLVLLVYVPKRRRSNFHADLWPSCCLTFSLKKSIDIIIPELCWSEKIIFQTHRTLQFENCSFDSSCTVISIITRAFFYTSLTDPLAFFLDSRSRTVQKTHEDDRAFLKLQQYCRRLLWTTEESDARQKRETNHHKGRPIICLKAE